MGFVVFCNAMLILIEHENHFKVNNFSILLVKKLLPCLEIN